MREEGYDPKVEEIYHLKGDMDTGISSSINLTKTALGHPKIRYENKHGQKFVLTCDVYRMGEELNVHLICPKCRNALSIKSSKKQMSYDHISNSLSVQQFQCTWEIQEELLGNVRNFGMSLCRWSAVIDNNLARDA